MDFTFLGTGAGMPAKERNVTSLAMGFPEYDGDLWLFDCGEGTQRQILYTSVRMTKLTAIFVTHLHGDHLFGLPGILGSRSFQGAETLLTLIGPVGLREYVETSLKLSGTHLHYPIEIREIGQNGPVYENDHFQVETDELDHGIQSFGYRITEKDIPGELLVDKLRMNGVEPGPIYGKFKSKEWVTLPDGRQLKTSDFLSQKRKGRRIAIIGDTRPCASALRLADQADLLVHESTFRNNAMKLAHDYHHSTSVQAAEIAKKANVKKLILTHLSSRYQKADQLALLAEAKQIFPQSNLASDFSVFHLVRQSRD